MKLYNIGSEYAIIETEYGISSIDTTYDRDEYNIIPTSKPIIAKCLNRSVIDCIKENGNYNPHELIHVWEGTITSTGKTESVTIYIPDSWY